MRHKGYIEDIPIDFGDKNELLELISGWIGKTEKSRQIVTLNALMLISALKDGDLNHVIRKADLVTVDGRGVLLALQKKGYANVAQLTGVEVTKSLLTYCMDAKFPVYFYGGVPKVSIMLSRILSQSWPGLTISAIRDGYGSKLTPYGVMEEIIQKKPALVIAGIGSPAQEIFLAEVLRYMEGTVGIGVGGALDVISGFKRETPSLLRENALEWLYRMFQDPAKFKKFPHLVKFWYKFLR